MDDLYREIIIERFKDPQFRKELDSKDISFEDENPLCGDKIRIDLKLDNNSVIIDAGFSGHGCAISQAAADLLIESIVGKDLDYVKSLTKEHILGLLGIELGPVRLKCALLSLKVLKAGAYGMQEARDELVN